MWAIIFEATPWLCRRLTDQLPRPQLATTVLHIEPDFPKLLIISRDLYELSVREHLRWFQTSTDVLGFMYRSRS